MEDASKALLMAGGILIGILILSLAAFLFIDFGQTAAKVNDQVAQAQTVQFNSKFTVYETYQGREDLTIYDIITIAGFARENNKYYDYNSNYTVQIKLKLTGSGEKDLASQTLTDSNFDSIKTTLINDYDQSQQFECKNLGFKAENGRIEGLLFTQK